MCLLWSKERSTRSICEDLKASTLIIKPIRGGQNQMPRSSEFYKTRRKSCTVRKSTHHSRNQFIRKTSSNSTSLIEPFLASKRLISFKHPIRAHTISSQIPCSHSSVQLLKPTLTCPSLLKQSNFQETSTTIDPSATVHLKSSLLVATPLSKTHCLN